MADLNSVNVVGRFGQKPELRTTPAGLSVASFSIAIKSGYGDKERTNWVDCVAWKNTAEFITRYFSRGDTIAISGALQTRDFVDKNGNKRKATEILVNSAHFTGSKGNNTAADTNAPNTANFEPITADDDLPF